MTDTPKIPDLTPVKSSNIEAIGHDGRDMYIRFRGGSLYQYHDVPAEAHKAIMDAGSHGSHFTQHIRGAYSFTKINEPKPEPPHAA